MEAQSGDEQVVADPDLIEQWTSTVVLGDGDTAEIRPITPDDAPALAEFHERQSPESRYRRFFSPKPTLSERELVRFTEVDQVDRAALLVEARGDFVAWASYERLGNRTDAEVAFMVDDEWHGKGIATLLLEHLAAMAQSNGIERFTAQTLGDNRGMLAVFSKAGWPVHRRFESGVIDVDFPLADTSEFIDSVERREQRADSRAVARLLLPTSIAVIGASDVEGSVGQLAWSNVSGNPRCAVYPVNPTHATIGGRTSYPEVGDVPDEVGVAVIAVPEHALVDTIEQCIAKRVRGAVVITAITTDAIDVDELVAHARRNGLRLIGPSSFGVASPRPDTRLQAALVDVRLPPGNIAVSMQSGTLATSLLLLADRLEVGLSWFVSLGDKRDVSANDLLQFWEDDEATSVVCLYTESLGNPRKFSRIARRVSASKPIVAVRTGAALIGAANAALYQQTGLIEVPTVAALLDTARVFASQPLMRGDRVALLSNARSPCVLASATLETAGMQVVDHGLLDWRSTADDYRSAVSGAVADDDVDAVIVIHAPATSGSIDEQIDAVEAAAANAGKPIVAVMLGAADGPLRRGSSIPNFSFPEQAAAVVARLAAYSRWRTLENDEPPEQTTTDIDAARAGSIVRRHIDEGTVPTDEVVDLLAAYGVAMPATAVVASDDAVAAAHRVGFPVAVKAAGRRIGRSVEAGIALDLSDDSDIEHATTIMREHLGAGADEVLVQRMVPPGADIRIRASVDPQLGPMITVGIGGVQADAIGDEVSRLAPVSPTTARRLLTMTRAATLLDEDQLDLVADHVTRVAQLVSDHAEIDELDLNPVIVSGDECWVVDATVRLRPRQVSVTAIRRLG